MACNILFVEDEGRGVTPYFSALRKLGHTCELARDGDEAIDKLMNKNFDLICLDVMFPSGDSIRKGAESRQAGLELLAKIRSNRVDNCSSKIQVIVLTAVMDEEIEEQMRALGVTEYLKKPVSYKIAIQTINNALTKQRVLSAYP
ncbi:response regulator [candidate division KSB1 bacterium]|nr:response regulator [candidate division KSB1 bacterium]